jgi:antitoxin ParD1/3/4
MRTVRKTITLTDKQDDWIKAQIDAGYYVDDSEYIRDLIRREQERNAETEAIRIALIEGENRVKQNLSMPLHSRRECGLRIAE